MLLTINVYIHLQLKKEPIAMFSVDNLRYKSYQTNPRPSSLVVGTINIVM